MKKRVFVMLVMFFSQVVCAAALHPDSEEIARALLFFKETKKYHGSFYGQKTNTVWTWGSFVMNKDRRIIKLTVDDKDIPIDPQHPLHGLPFPKGMILSQFSVNLDAIDADGRTKAHGQYGTITVDDSTVIRIVLMPYLVPKFVPYAAPSGVDARFLHLVLDNGAVFWYDTVLGGFTVWLYPFGEEQNYEIADGSNTTLFIGFVGPMSKPRPADEKGLNISFAGNVDEFTIPYVSEYDGWILPLRNQRFDGWIVTGVSNTLAKVYTTDLEGRGGLIVRLYDFDARVTVKGWVENGSLPTLFCVPFEQGDNYIAYCTRPELGKLIVTLTSPHTNEFFGVDFIMFPNDVDPTVKRK